jgi:outer membrane lipoprotein-sorting protein
MSIFFVLAMALQGETAEESYRRLEETLQKARSLSLQYRIEFAIGGATMTVSGSVLLKEGNRLKITCSGAAGAQKLDAAVVSDGSTLRSLPLHPGANETEWPTPKSLNESVTTAFLRAGCLDLYRLPYRMHEHGRDPKESLIVSELRSGDDDSGLRTLLYKLEEGSGHGEMKVWFDPKTRMLRKRVFTVPPQGNTPQVTVTETYESVKVDSEISEDSFKLKDK